MSQARLKGLFGKVPGHGTNCTCRGIPVQGEYKEKDELCLSQRRYSILESISETVLSRHYCVLHESHLSITTMRDDIICYSYS